MRTVFLLIACLLTSLAPCAAAVAQDTSLAPVSASRQAANLAIIPIHGPIDRYTALSVERRLGLALESGADAVVFELDTPGGEVGAVLEICNMIKATPMKTAAWVNQDAYSGGAIIALACEETFVASYATMGDAAPISMNPVQFAQGLQRTERQKILQPLITEVVDSARRHGYDERLVQGFLTLGIELWLIEETATGRRVFVNESQYRELFNSDPPRDAVRAASGGVAGTEAAAGDPLTPEIRTAVERAQELPPSIPDLSNENPDEWTLVEYATDGEALLTLKTEDLIRFGLASETVADEAELTALFGATNVAHINLNWSERLVIVMTSMWIRGILVLIFLVAAFVEFIGPGVGLAGGVALAALALLIGPPALVGAAAWWALVTILCGIALITLELFVLPGFGLLGLAGMIALFIGLVGAVIGPGPLFPDSPSRSQDLLYALSTVLLSGASAGVAIFFITRYHGSIPIMNKLVLSARSGDTTENDGLLTSMGPPKTQEQVKAGDTGVTTTPLHPSGTAEIDGRLVDVVASLGFIENGRPVRVVEASSFRVAVTEITEHPQGGDE